MLPLVLFFSVIVLIGVFIGFNLAVIFYWTPVMICYLLSEINNCCKYWAAILLILECPALGVAFGIIVSVGMLTYPCFRRCVDNIMYNFCDGVVMAWTLYFLSALGTLLDCVLCREEGEVKSDKK